MRTLAAGNAVAQALLGIRLVEILGLLAVTTLLARRWRRTPTQSSLAVLGAFGCLLLVLVVASYVPPPGSLRQQLFTRGLIVVLLAMPYLLARFAWALGGLGTRAHRVALGLFGVEVLATLALPLPPGPGRAGDHREHRLHRRGAGWRGRSSRSPPPTGCWSAGRGQSVVVRRRMSALALGAVLLTVAVFASSATGSSADTSPGDAPRCWWP